MNECAIEGCGQQVRARGWCNRHYKRWYKYGDPLALRWWFDSERFWSKVPAMVYALGTDCWEWGAAKNLGGYGVFHLGGRKILAHRYAYEERYGPVAGDMQLDHLCRNRLCVNPGHLEVVTQQENIRRGNGGAHWAAKTHCPQGHPYDGENMYVNPRGGRECRACRREAQARFHSKAA